MTSPAPRTPDTPIATGPQLAWDAIAQHARDHHGARWTSDREAITAITGAFDGILPAHYGYHPATATIATTDHLPANRLPTWTDLRRLTCTAAAIAARPPCDIETLYNSEPPGPSDCDPA